jgi:TPM domain
MGRLMRIFKHRSYDEADVRRVLGDAALKRLEARVHDSEKLHSGEIRLCIEAGLPTSYLWKRLSVRDRAIAMFGKLRVWDTEHNNGVLIYLLYAEHKIEIVADRGLKARVPDPEWQAIIERMREPLRAGKFEEGLGLAIDAVEALLEKHFPAGAGAANPNELSNKPWIG